MSIRIYVGNLPKQAIERDELQNYFANAGESVTTKLIKDRKTRECRGFAFVTVDNDELAEAFINKFDGQEFMGQPLKIEKAQPRTKGKEKEDSPVLATSNTNKPSVNAERKGKKPKRSPRQAASSERASTTESIQPDPRWADKLSQLKEMLAAQTTNS